MPLAKKARNEVGRLEDENSPLREECDTLKIMLHNECKNVENLEKQITTLTSSRIAQ